MALTINYTGITETFLNGFQISKKKEEFKNVYIKVLNISGNKDEVSFSYIGTHNECVIISKSHTFVPISDDFNFLAQSYEYLKTLEEFKDAEDC